MAKPMDRLISSALRATGCVDLNPLSPTFGCADRNYWHYQDGKGFAVASFQVAMLGLMGVARLTHKPVFSEAGLACLNRWSQDVEAGDGMFDEYFKGQKSFCATAYSAMAAAVTLQWVSGNENQAAVSSLKKSIDSLVSVRNRPDAANQTLAAMLAYDLAYVDAENPFSPRLSADGRSLMEYGGFDLGYSLKCLDICALGMSILPDAKGKKYRTLAEQLLDRLYTVCVDYTFHHALSSRGNPHRLLGGLNLFTRLGDLRAKAILEALQSQDRFPDLVDVENCDDKYLCFFHLTSLLISADVDGEILKPKTQLLPYSNRREPVFLDEEQYVFYRSGSTRVAISKTGPALRIESRGGNFVTSGWITKAGEKVWVSAEHDTSHVQVDKKSENEITISIPLFFRRKKERTKLVHFFWFSFALRLLMATPVLNLLVRSFIYRQTSKKQGGERWGLRTVRVIGGAVEVVDEFLHDCELMWLNTGWSMTDGHATRMRGLTEKVFQGPMKFIAGKKISIFHGTAENK